MRRRNLAIDSTARTLTLRGRFDAHETAEVATHLDTLGTDAPVDVCLDDVRFLDHAALGLLESRTRELTAVGRELRIVAASRAATIILELAQRAGMTTALAAPQPAVAMAVAA